jgi:hypothetical protein
MKWLRDLMDKYGDSDTFWREWHRQRREKKLEYWRLEAGKSLARYNSATRMVSYYQDALYGDSRSEG